MCAGAGLVELDLSDNAFGPNGMKGLTKLLESESCFTLQILRLHNNGLGVTGGKVIVISNCCFYAYSITRFCMILLSQFIAIVLFMFLSTYICVCVCVCICMYVSQN